MKLGNYQMKVHDGEGRLIMKASLVDNKIVKVEINTVDHKCLASTSEEDKSWLWHHMYGHLNFRSLGMLNLKKMVYGLPQVKEPSQLCEECCKAKQSRKEFKHHLPMKPKEKLELFHYDVCGPFEFRLNGGNCYFLTFIHEFTRYMWIHLIEKKSEVFTQFKKFKLHVEKQSECKLKKLRTDGGGEYTS